MRTAIFSAKYEQLDAIRYFAGQAARDADMDDIEVYAIELAVDEACTNVIEHAYEEVSGGEIECTCDGSPDGVKIIIRDHGRPFDPSNVSTPDLTTDLKGRKIGGLGIYMIRQLMDEVRYEPLGNVGNVLTMVKHRKKVK